MGATRKLAVQHVGHTVVSNTGSSWTRLGTSQPNADSLFLGSSLNTALVDHNTRPRLYA
jgi:hypothetical protein